jgi:hypothetical protein
MGATCRVLFSPSIIGVSRSSDAERDNDVMVDRRRDWPIEAVMGEFSRWSAAAAVAATACARGVTGRIVAPSGNLGRYPVWMLPSTLVFDWHTHLHHDVAPAIGKPAPPTDRRRLAATIEWMLAGMEQMNREQMRWVDRPLRLSLTGLAGGSWDIAPAGDGLLVVTPAIRDDLAAHVTGSMIDFPAWATTRQPWRDAGLTITGDGQYAADFLDAVNLI